MKNKFTYTYTVLRYRHDPLADEQVNVGLVLHSPSGRVAKFKTRHTFGRFREMYPDLDGDAFKASLKAVEKAVDTLAEREGGDLFASTSDALTLAKRALPPDGSSFVWGTLGSGTTDNLAAQMDKLFARFVALYDGQKRHARGDADVWRPVRELLVERKIADRLQPKVIRSSVDSVEFEHAWKNGSWHVYEPVSFDLATEDSIREKARRWVGQLTTVREAAEPFKAHFVVGRPSDRQLLPAYKAAIAMLGNSPVPAEVVEEDRISELVDQIEDEIRTHDTP